VGTARATLDTLGRIWALVSLADQGRTKLRMARRRASCARVESFKAVMHLRHVHPARPSRRPPRVACILRRACVKQGTLMPKQHNRCCPRNPTVLKPSTTMQPHSMQCQTETGQATLSATRARAQTSLGRAARSCSVEHVRREPSSPQWEVMHARTARQIRMLQGPAAVALNALHSQVPLS